MARSGKRIAAQQHADRSRIYVEPDIYGAAGVHSASRPTIVFHGDADTTVHASNGLAILAGAAPGKVSEGRSPSGRGFTRTIYPASPTHHEAEHWRLHAAGHAWSGGSAQGSYTRPDGIDASREMLRFFLAHRLDDATQG